MRKKKLFDVYEKCKLGNNEHRLIMRKGDNKKKANVEDVLSLLSHLDHSKFELPKFVAVDPDHLPRLKASEEDIVNLTMSISDIKASLLDVQKLTDVLNKQ